MQILRRSISWNLPLLSEKKSRRKSTKRMSWNLRRERERMSRINLLKKKTQPNLHQTVMMTKRKKM